VYRVTAALTGLFLFGADESGCEADMAEGSVEEDSGDMLGPTAAPILQTPAPSNMSIKDEVRDSQFRKVFSPNRKFSILLLSCYRCWVLSARTSTFVIPTYNKVVADYPVRASLFLDLRRCYLGDHSSLLRKSIVATPLRYLRLQRYHVATVHCLSDVCSGKVQSVLTFYCQLTISKRKILYREELKVIMGKISVFI
jgi:hypothetical protein